MTERAVPREPRTTTVKAPRSTRLGLPPVLAGAAATVMVGEVLGQAGHPTIHHLEYASALVAGLPDELREAAHEPMTATALVYALLTSDAPERRESQLGLLRDLISEPVYREADWLGERVSSMAASVRLPLVELCLPALRRLSPGQYSEFERAIQELVAADGQIEIHEYALQRMLRRHLEPQFRSVGRPVTQFYVLKPLVPDLVVLLSEAAPALKRRILEASANAVAADGRLAVREAELLRAIADALDCPLPPYLALP